ncbi:hypothetical protein [Gordonia humi]|uniref:DUF4232 domain-containing protein n=1 Tax=Gordonia humi TaxID=686429 RepID=A0A840F0H1_9ACTN|nr:hypothetical protein [Gordonia humi]MBB4136038.1 hypothetical protein [Gordonia humi]
MRARAFVIALTGVAVVACGPVGDDGRADAVTAELRSGRDVYRSGTAPRLSLTVHNDTQGSCSIPKHGIGSLLVTSITRDGTAIASASRSIPTFAPPLDAVRAALSPLAGGESTALDVETQSSPAAVVSHRIEANGTMSATTWPVDRPGEYTVTAALRIPDDASHTGLPPLCAVPGTSSVGFTVE